MNRQIKALIADDEFAPRETLKALLEEFFPEVAVMKIASTTKEAVTYLSSNYVDVAFLDISFGNNETGFDILDTLKRYKCQIVFVTAYEEYALKAFQYKAINYLIKPIHTADLLETVERIKNNIAAAPPVSTYAKAGTDRFIAIPNKTQADIINFNEIEYVEADGSYTKYYLTDGRSYTLAKNLKYFEEYSRESNDFIRIHKSFMVNKKQVVSVSKTIGNTLKLKSGIELPISISYKELTEYLGI